MATTKRRSRNIARKPNSRPNSFVPQNATPGAQRSDRADNLSPEAGRWEPDPGSASPPYEAAASRAQANRGKA